MNNNQLSGSIPAALASLGNLEFLHLRDNPGLSGCVPASLRDIPHNDLNHLGLPDCPP